MCDPCWEPVTSPAGPLCTFVTDWPSSLAWVWLWAVRCVWQAWSPPASGRVQPCSSFRLLFSCVFLYHEGLGARFLILPSEQMAYTFVERTSPLCPFPALPHLNRAPQWLDQGSLGTCGWSRRWRGSDGNAQTHLHLGTRTGPAEPPGRDGTLAGAGRRGVRCPCRRSSTFFRFPARDPQEVEDVLGCGQRDAPSFPPSIRSFEKVSLWWQRVPGRRSTVRTTFKSTEPSGFTRGTITTVFFAGRSSVPIGHSPLPLPQPQALT